MSASPIQSQQEAAKTQKENRIARLEATSANKMSVKESTEEFALTKEAVRISSKEGKRVRSEREHYCVLLHQHILQHPFSQNWKMLVLSVITLLET